MVPDGVGIIVNRGEGFGSSWAVYSGCQSLDAEDKFKIFIVLYCFQHGLNGPAEFDQTFVRRFPL